MTKAKLFSLLDQVGETFRSLESTALRSNALSPADYLSLLRSRVAEEQKPGYLTRLETLQELQRSYNSSSVESGVYYNSALKASHIGVTSGRGSRGRGRSHPFASDETAGGQRVIYQRYGNTNRQLTSSFENGDQAIMQSGSSFDRTENDLPNVSNSGLYDPCNLF